MRALVLRRATLADIGACAEVLADAFEHYPWELYTVAADNHRERIRALQFDALRLLGLPGGEVWVAEEPGQLVAVSAWMPPGFRASGETEDALLASRAVHEGDRHAASLAADELVNAMPGRLDGYFLGTVGVSPARQGQGIGHSLLAPVLNRIAREQQPAQLSTSTEANVRFYERLGFTVTSMITIPGGPPNWLMTRTAEGHPLET